MKKRFQPTLSMKRLRRLVPRAIYIVNKLRKDHAALEAIADAMIATLERFVKTYDLFHAGNASAQAEVQEGRREIDRLRALVRTWLPVLGRDMAIDTTRLRLHTDVPDDVIAAARLLLQVIHETTQRGVSVSYAPTVIEALEGAIAAAESEWHEARTAITERQNEGAILREAAVAAQADLIALRQVIQAALGRRSLDYQALRADPGGADSGVEDENETSIGTDGTAEDGDRESGEFGAPASVAS